MTSESKLYYRQLLLSIEDSRQLKRMKLNVHLASAVNCFGGEIVIRLWAIRLD